MTLPLPSTDLAQHLLARLAALGGADHPVIRMRNSFPVFAGNWLLWTCLAVFITLIVVPILWRLATGPSNRAARQLTDTPERLFNDLLNHLLLSDADRKILRAMASGARLRHPTMCLLSPHLLHWSAELWRTEQGPDVVTTEKLSRIDQISIQLYDRPAAPAKSA